MTEIELRPLDFLLLEELLKGRNLGGNLHITLDVTRPYTNERLRTIADYGLVERVGPNENVGLYQITDKGRAALEYQDEYDEIDDFDAFIEEQLNTQF